MPYSRAVADPNRLTDREYEVWVRLGLGYRPSEIAAELGISVKTVEAHITRIREKRGYQTAREVLVAAIVDRVLLDYGLIRRPEGRE